MKIVQRLWKEGQDLTEYVLMVLIALAQIVSMQTLGPISNVFSNAAPNLTTAS